MSFVIDTNTCSSYIRGHPRVFSRFVQHSGRLDISVVTLGELTIWRCRAKAPAKRTAQVQDLLAVVAMLDVSSDIAGKYGKVQAGLLDRGVAAPPLDLLIAATALTYDYTVVSNNTADFANVPGLSVVDWLAP